MAKRKKPKTKIHCRRLAKKRKQTKNHNRRAKKD